MKPILFLFALLILSLVPLCAGPTIPKKSAWEQHPVGIATAMTFASSHQKDIQKNLLTVYIKNTSDTITYWDNIQFLCMKKAFFEVGFAVEGVNYVDWPAGVPVPRIKYGVDIKPDETYSETVDIPEKQMALIKGCPISCRISLLNLPNGKLPKRYVVETAPKILVPGL